MIRSDIDAGLRMGRRALALRNKTDVMAISEALDIPLYCDRTDNAAEVDSADRRQLLAIACLTDTPEPSSPTTAVFTSVHPHKWSPSGQAFLDRNGALVSRWYYYTQVDAACPSMEGIEAEAGGMTRMEMPNQLAGPPLAVGQTTLYGHTSYRWHVASRDGYDLDLMMSQDEAYQIKGLRLIGTDCIISFDIDPAAPPNP